MKRLLIVLFCTVLLLCSCQGSEESYELGGYQSENGYWYIDLEDPTIEAKKIEVKVKLSDGREDTAYIRRPILNVDLEGANAVTESIKTYIDGKYGDYFKKPDDKIVKIDYETDDFNDILTVLVTESIITPDEEYTLYSCFYYDAMCDTELNIMEYSNINGAQLSAVYKAILETDWAKEYEKTTGESPYEDVLECLVCHGELKFDAYCINPDGKTQTKLELQVEDVPLQLPDIMG